MSSLLSKLDSAPATWVFWDGPKMPATIEWCLRTIELHAPGPVVVLNAENVAELELDLRPEWADLPCWADKVDYLRPRVLHRYGGIFIDADVVVFRSLGRLLELVGDGKNVVGEVVPQGISVGLLAAKPGSDLMLAWAARQDAAIDAGKAPSWGWLGTYSLGKPTSEFQKLEYPDQRPFPWTSFEGYLREGEWSQYCPERGLPLVWPLYWEHLGKALGDRLPPPKTVLASALDAATGEGKCYADTYWDKRYRAGGHSGPNDARNWKAQTISELIKEYKPRYIQDWGVGDGTLLAQLDVEGVETYLGLDVSLHALDRLRTLDGPWNDWDTKLELGHIRALWNRKPEKPDMVLSIDVLFHLIAEDNWREYLDELFGERSRAKTVVLLANDGKHPGIGEHVRVRPFVEYVKDRYGYNYELVRIIETPNPHACFSNFTIWQRIG